MTQIRLLIVALACLVGVSPTGALAQTDISGAWEVAFTTPTGPTTLDVNIKQDGEALSGELISPLGTAPFKGTLVKDALNVSASVDIQGNALVMTFTGTVAADATMSGNVKFGDFGEAPWTAKRKPAGAPAVAAAAAPATTTTPPATTDAAAATTTTAAGAGITGTWNLMMDIAGNQIPLTVAFKQDGEKVTGTMTSPQGEVIVNGTMSGNALKLEFSAPTPQGAMNIVMTGDLGASGLVGKMSIEGLGEADWTGTRAK